MKDTIELPDLDTMVLKESLNESDESDIGDILDDLHLDDDEKVKRIHDIFLKTSDVPTDKKDDDHKIIKDKISDDIIVMRNGSINDDHAFVGNHVISKTLGDEIRKEQNITPKDPDFGLSDDEAAMVQEAFPIIDGIFKAVESGDDELADEAKKMKEKIKGRIRRSREGIINWKDALQDFVSMKSKRLKKAGLRKNIYQRTGIGVYHREKDIRNYNKCIFYIDTSYSVNNNETQLIPIMVGEIGKVMMDCHFDTVDIHLFDDSVYNEHFDVDAATVRDENWGLEGVSSGGTNIHSVYRHIINHYINDGQLNRDVDAIIIISDVSGMQSSGSIKPFLNRIDTEALRRMLYVIYDDYKMTYLSEVIEEIGKLVAKESTYYVIPLEAFKKQMLEESMKINKKKNLLEALGGASKIVQKKAETGQVADRTEQEKEERLRRSAIQGARALGTLDQVLPELVAKLQEFFPNCRIVKEMTAVLTTPGTYYISDKATVILNSDVKASESRFFMDACKHIDFEAVVGNVIIDSVSFMTFPKSFPKQIKGNFTIRNCKFLKSFENAPIVVTGALYLDAKTINSRKITDVMVDEYANKISKHMELSNIEGGKGIKSVFRKNESLDESMRAVIRKRIMLGESFIYERFGGLLDKPKGEKHGYDPQKWEVYNKNKEIFSNLRDYIKIPWGDIPEENIKVKNTVKDIRDAITGVANIDDIDIAKKGITVLTDEDGKISVILANEGKDKKSKIIYFKDYETGNDIYNIDTIKDEIDSRYNAYENITRTLLDIGIEPKYISEKIERLGRTTLEICALGHLFQGLLWANGVESKDYGKHILYPAKNVFGPTYTGSNRDYVDDIMKIIYGEGTRRYSRARKVGISYDSFQVNVPNIGYTTVNLGSDNQNKRNAFIVTAEFCLRENNENIFKFMSDEYLRAMLKGIAIRAVDDYPKYTLSDVDAIASHDELADMAYKLKDVIIENTALKQQSYTKGLKTKDDASRVLLLFPERMNDMYYFNVDVKPLTVDYLSSVMKRISQSQDERRRGEKESRTVSSKRSTLDAINAERAKRGEKPMTYMEYKQDVISNLAGSFNENVKNLVEGGALSDALNDILSKSYDIFPGGKRNDSVKKLEYNVRLIPGAIDYLSEILDPKQDNPVVKHFKPNTIEYYVDILSDFRKDIDDAVSETSSSVDFRHDVDQINFFSFSMINAIKDILKHDPRTEKITDTVLEDTLAKRTEDLKTVAKTAEKDVAKTTAEVSRKNEAIHKTFSDNIDSIENAIPGVLAAIKGIDFNKLNPKIVQRIRGGKQGLVSMISNDSADALELMKKIHTDAMKNGVPTGAFNWILTSLSDVEQLAKDAPAIVELASDTNVSDANLLRAITALDDKLYDISVNLSDYDTSAAQQDYSANIG